MVELAREFFNSAEGKAVLRTASNSQLDKPFKQTTAIPLSEPGSGEEPATMIMRPRDHGLPSANGTSLDDIIDAGSINDGNETTAGQAIISGGEGYDTAVLKGNQNDYFMRMPQTPMEYPRTDEKVWNGQESLYGYNIEITNLKTGDRVYMNGVENIVFDPEDKVNSPKALIQNGAALKGLDSITMQDAIKMAEENMTPEEQQNARIAATPEAVNAIAADPQLGSIGMGGLNPEQINERAASIVSDVEQQGVDTSSVYKPPEPMIAPNSPQTLQSMGIQLQGLSL